MMTSDNEGGMPSVERDMTPAQLARVGQSLRAAVPPVAFSGGFADRTMARIAAERTLQAPTVLRAAAMQRSFRLLAAAAAIAIVSLGVHNTWLVRADDTSFVEAAIGLQPVSGASLLAYTSEALQ